MGTVTLTRLGTTLDRDNWEWLQVNCQPIADAVEAEVKAGATSEQIGTFMLRHIGPDRSALVARCVSAARYLEQAFKKA